MSEGRTYQPAPPPPRIWTDDEVRRRDKDRERANAKRVREVQQELQQEMEGIRATSRAEQARLTRNQDVLSHRTDSLESELHALAADLGMRIDETNHRIAAD